MEKESGRIYSPLLDVSVTITPGAITFACFASIFLSTCIISIITKITYSFLHLLNDSTKDNCTQLSGVRSPC